MVEPLFKLHLDQPPIVGSVVQLAGDEAKHAAERALLLKTLRHNAWNLTHTARELEMPGPSQVLRAIKDLGLSAEYDAARNART
jgi:transcriptional regulator with GAF, ATPase, and Fis domain